MALGVPPGRALSLALAPALSQGLRAQPLRKKAGG